MREYAQQFKAVMYGINHPPLTRREVSSELHTLQGPFTPLQRREKAFVLLSTTEEISIKPKRALAHSVQRESANFD